MGYRFNSTASRECSLLPFDVDRAECSSLGGLEDVARFAREQADSAVVLAFDQLFAAVITDELDTIAKSIIEIFVFTLEGERFDEEIEADVWFVPAYYVSF